ncbi:unnamed protein product [Thlaspi arvense]|uniref:Uncharacterized protein n=1 Tax=Thlaspi arvense TaxID=13288 RepID=A0AAU9RD49_THLAR|nr:unnamed protein product [Thlaspi arvense]
MLDMLRFLGVLESLEASFLLEYMITRLSVLKEITSCDISLVVHGTVAESGNFQKEEDNLYAVPKTMGIFQILESPLDITTSTIIRRIVANHEAYPTTPLA